MLCYVMFQRFRGVSPDGIFNKTLQFLLPKQCFDHHKKHANTVIVCTLKPIRRLEFLMPYAGNV